MFGNEIQYSRVTEKEEINMLLNNLNPIKIIKDFLSGQVSMELDYECYEFKCY